METVIHNATNISWNIKGIMSSGGMKLLLARIQNLEFIDLEKTMSDELRQQ